MKLSARHADDVLVLEVVGEVDVGTVARFRQGLGTAREAAQQAGHGRVVVDLAGVPFMDSSGLGALVSAHKRAVADGGTVEVSGAQRVVRAMLDLTGLSRVLSVTDRQPPAPSLAARP
jgi:anti-sigma B factor antagonist